MSTTIKLPQTPTPLEDIYSDNSGTMKQLGWTLAQLSLYLHCIPNIHSENSKFALCGVQVQADADIAEQVWQLLRQAGKPVPLAQLPRKLTAQKIITEPALRAILQKDARFVIKGPLVTPA
ncbi:MAG: hypothetical protein GX639_19660 [Fibrobacter sp.]|nr:hypothetical protein [Fibrobacter sp.]